VRNALILARTPVTVKLHPNIVTVDAVWLGVPMVGSLLIASYDCQLVRHYALPRMPEFG